MRPLIFYADDDPLLQQLVQLRLEKDGYEVQVAADGAAALAALEKLSPALIILDQHMPRLSGLETAQRLSRHPRLKAVPIMMLTASGAPEVVNGARALHAAGYLLKPFSADVLAQRVRAVLAGRRRPPRSGSESGPDIIID